jgi:predicted nucleotidyltransferase
MLEPSTSLPKLLEKIAKAFEKEHIPYMIIGGQAVLLYGEPRLTKDIDITLGLDINELPRLRNIAFQIGLTLLVQNEEKFVRETMVLPTIHEPSGFRVDLIFSFSKYEQEALKRVNKIRIGSIDACYASLEDVLIQKTISGRPRDIEDIKAMILKNPHFDIQYVNKWLQDFSQALNLDFIDQFKMIYDEIIKNDNK